MISLRRPDVPDDGCASSFFNSGGWGTSSWVRRRFREVGTIDCGGTRLKDGNLFQGLLWLFLKVIMERDWLGCEDVDECLDNIVV